ncbi:MAG: energy transducer TonB [Alloprevotella sp.]
MKQSELLSKAWCDLIFDGRNKDYGAYRLRSRTGRRMRFALIITAVLAFVATVIPAGLNLYLRIKLLKSFEEASTQVKMMKKLEQDKPYETKRISAGRAMPTATVIKGADNHRPEIVEETPAEVVFGTGGEETVVVDGERLLNDRDTLHNRNVKDLPYEGPQLVAVEVVKEMPLFPGGFKALMEWLDKEVDYPRRLIDENVAGDMEVTFFIDAQGLVKDPEITKKLHPDLDRIVLAAIQRMPPWRPGTTDGRPCAVCITLPLHFEPK